MNKENQSRKFFAIGMVITLALVLSGGLACTNTQTRPTPPSGSLDIQAMENMVLVKVGNETVTVADILRSPMVYGLMHDQIILPLMVSQEAESRGIFISDEEVQEELDLWFEGAGGEDVFYQTQISPNWPKVLVPDDIKKIITFQKLQQKIVEDQYDTDHGPATDEEIQQAWDRNPTSYKQRYVSENAGVAVEDVTLEMAWDMVTDDVRRLWIADHMSTLLEDLEQKYDIDNLILEAAQNGELGGVVTESMLVPPVSTGTQGFMELNPTGETFGAGDETGNGEESTETEQPSETEETH